MRAPKLSAPCIAGLPSKIRFLSEAYSFLLNRASR